MLGLSTSLADLTMHQDQADMLAMFDDAQNGEIQNFKMSEFWIKATKIFNGKLHIALLSEPAAQL